jgi:hypothetical protein
LHYLAAAAEFDREGTKPMAISNLSGLSSVIGGMTLACMAAVPAAHSEVITFEDYAGASASIGDNGPYKGLEWLGFGVADDTLYPDSGFAVGAVSPEKLAWTYTVPGFPSLIRSPDTTNNFTLASFYLTAAFREGISVFVTGWNNGVQQYSTQLSPSPLAATLFTLNWSGIDRIEMFGSGGTVFYANTGTTPAFLIDNIDITFDGPASVVPLPGALPLMLAGLGAFGVMSRRKRKEVKKG